jgi:hypothetical protein
MGGLFCVSRFSGVIGGKKLTFWTPREVPFERQHERRMNGHFGFRSDAPV